MQEKRSKIKLSVVSEYDGWRLDKFLAVTRPEFSRGIWQKLIKDGGVCCSGKITTSGKLKVAVGNLIEITELPQNNETPLPQPEDIALETLFEDKNLIIINKPAGMVVHPGDGSEHGTVVNALLHKFQKTGLEPHFDFTHSAGNFDSGFLDKHRPGIVHRLDKDTSGALLIAKNQESLERFQAMFKNREIKKSYLGMIHGHPKKNKDTISHAIARHPVNRKKMSTSKDGKHAVTHFSIIKNGFIENQPISLLDIQIETGRTHQIRVHMADIKLPIIGDKTYGGSRRAPHAPRQMLHAWELQFKHPFTGRTIKLTCPIPDDMEELIEKMK